MFALGRLQKAEIHWLFGFFVTQRSVLGGMVPLSDLSQVQHQVMMVMYPQGVLKQLLEVCLFVVALATTKNLVKMILEAQRPDMVAAVRALVPEYREILLFSLKYMVVMAFFGGVIVLISYVLTQEHFREFAFSKIFVAVYGLVAEGCLAWLLVPSAIRLLRDPGSHTVSTRDRQTGTIFCSCHFRSHFRFGISGWQGREHTYSQQPIGKRRNSVGEHGYRQHAADSDLHRAGFAGHSDDGRGNIYSCIAGDEPG
ncbi:MAG TPA: hypothetical protein VGT08_21085 [Terracidiphilus sp.]|nr:hypothetical protein [Terracidiphilus sp.]